MLLGMQARDRLKQCLIVKPPKGGCQRPFWPLCQTNLFSLAVAGGKNKRPCPVYIFIPLCFQDAALFDSDISWCIFNPLLSVLWLAGPIVQVRLVISGPKRDNKMHPVQMYEKHCKSLSMCAACVLPSMSPASHFNSAFSPEDMIFVELSYWSYFYLLLVIVAALIGVTM